MQSNFLAELVQRLFSKNPNFFKWVQAISILVALITGLPAFLETSGIQLPEAWESISNKAVAIAALVAAFIAQLPKQDVNQQPK